MCKSSVSREGEYGFGTNDVALYSPRGSDILILGEERKVAMVTMGVVDCSFQAIIFSLLRERERRERGGPSSLLNLFMSTFLDQKRAILAISYGKTT